MRRWTAFTAPIICGPKPILRIIKTMLEDKEVCVRRCREGYEFFKSLRQRKVDLAASRALQSPATAPA